MINYRVKPGVEVPSDKEFMKRPNFFYRKGNYNHPTRIEGRPSPDASGRALSVSQGDLYEVYRLYVLKSRTYSDLRTSGLKSDFLEDEKYVFIDREHRIHNNGTRSLTIEYNGRIFSLYSSDLREVDYLNEPEFNIDPETYQPKLYRMKELDNSKLSTNYNEGTQAIIFNRQWSYADRKCRMTSIQYSNQDSFTTDIEGIGLYKTDLIEFKLGDEDTRTLVMWSETRTSVVHFINDYISHQVRVRYAMFDLPREGLSNVVIDSVAPRYLYQARFRPEEARMAMNPPKTAVAISPWFAEIFGVKQMSVEQMCRILGYSKGRLQKLMTSVKEKQYNMMFIGYGGTNVSTVRNLDEISKLTNTINIFNNVTLYEPEEVEISNLLRFPLNPLSVTTSARRGSGGETRLLSRKINLVGQQLRRLSRTDVNLRAEFYNVNPDSAINQASFHNSEYEYNEDGSVKINEDNQVIFNSEIKSNKHIIYGAPGISTRQELSKYGNFISATHGGNSCALHLNPEQDDSLQVESYGVIKLGGFHMNQLRMSIGLLEALADPNFDPTVQDATLMEFAFTGSDQTEKDDDGNERRISLKTDVNYKFQLDHDGQIMTAEEADATLVADEMTEEPF